MAAVASRNAGPVFGGLMSAFTRRPTSSLDNFGVLSARRLNGPAPSALQNQATTGAFGVSEARSRLSDFVGGRYVPSSIKELASHMRGLFLRLETRKYGDAPPTNHLVDTVTRRSIPAVQVDSRLTARGLRRMFGGPTAAQTAAQRPAQQVSAEALALRNGMRPHLRSARGGPAFRDWADLRFMTPALLAGREYTVQAGRGFFGRALDHAQDDPAANLAILRRARSEGKRVVIPAATKEDAAAGRLIAGMPILLREGVVSAEDVHPTLAASQLEEAFGESLPEHYRKLAASAAPETPSGVAAKVVSIADFRAKFARRSDAVVDTEPSADLGFGGGAAGIDTTNIALRSEIDDYGRERIVVWDTRTDSEVAMGVHMLPEGVYPKEDASGMHLGHVQLDEHANISHLDRDMRLHNPYGAAFLPAPGSGQRPVFAIEGAPLSAAELRRRRDALFERPEPEVAASTTATAFGEIDDQPSPRMPGMAR